MFEFLTRELQYVEGALKYYNDNYTAPYRTEYVQQLTHVKEYLEDRIENFKREHAL